MKKHSLIRTIYLYLFTTIGLAVLTIALVRFIDIGLKAFVFTKAEQDRYEVKVAPPTPYRLEEAEKLAICDELSEEERASISEWLTDYQLWQNNQSETDYVVIRRHQDASLNLAMISVGLPLYFYHWSIIKKETKERKESQDV